MKIQIKKQAVIFLENDEDLHNMKMIGEYCERYMREKELSTPEKPDKINEILCEIKRTCGPAEE